MTALILGAWRRNLIELRRYAFDSVLQALLLYGLFVMILLGVRGLVDRPAETTISALVVGYVVFALVLTTYSSLASWTTTESLLGTFEQLAMAPYPLAVIFAIEFVVNLAVTVVLMGALLVAAMATAGRWLVLDLLGLMPLLLVLLIGVMGIAFLLGAAAAVFKRVGSLLNLLHIAIAALVVAPVDRFPVLTAFPVASPSRLIRLVTVDGVGFSGLPTADLILATVMSLTWCVAGVAVFVAVEKVARRRGLLAAH